MDFSNVITLVGDGSVGKSSLFEVYVSGRFPEEYVPTVCDSQTLTVFKGDTSIEYDIFDTAGGNFSHIVEQLIYPITTCFILCYSVVDDHSVYNLTEKWLKEIKQSVPYVVCGLKLDLKPVYPERYIPLGSIKTKVSKNIEIFEVSALEVGCRHSECEGVIDMLFERCLNLSLSHRLPKRNNEKCVLI